MKKIKLKNNEKEPSPYQMDEMLMGVEDAHEKGWVYAKAPWAALYFYADDTSFSSPPFCENDVPIPKKLHHHLIVIDSHGDYFGSVCGHHAKSFCGLVKQNIAQDTWVVVKKKFIVNP